MPSVFLTIPETAWVASNALAFAFPTPALAAKGHTVVAPRRAVAGWSDATREEQVAILDLVDVVKRQLDAQFAPAGYDVTFHIGPEGERSGHLHVHVIPRYEWTSGVALTTGGLSDPFLTTIRPLLAAAREIAIVAAFVQDSGLQVLEAPVFSAVERGARVRLLTGDYLDITQAEALQRMLDWQGAAGQGGEENGKGALEARVIETASLPGPSRSFHPKSWRFAGPEFGVAFVGSSNVSRSALMTGIEWNLRADRAESPRAYARVAEAFELLWTSARPLTFEWVTAYASRARAQPALLQPGESEAEPFTEAPPPHEIQQEALAALATTRAEGEHRALVVMATGLGKTLLAAYDADAFRADLGQRLRVLFIAHRRELLVQAATTLRQVLRRAIPDLRMGWFAEERAELDADVVVASVQKLSRPENLARLATERFDYVVVDEVHHVDAKSYRRILDVVDPGFLLGLTATPDRADEGDVLGLFDDNLAYRADLGTGIEAKRLVPFAYYGLKDTVDYAYESIPWRNRRFDPERLAAAVQTQERMERLWVALGTHVGTRTLVFCCSIPHAEFARRWLAERGLRVRAVHSEPISDDRSQALADLESGSIDAVCAVDLFNEGVDLPMVDRVVMLRPTESPVVFLQQLGRGLRIAPGKERLTVIDFVGNHRVFLDRVRTLLSFGERPTPLRVFLEGGEAPDLPPGCSVGIELGAIDLLRRLLPSGANAVETAYRERHAARGGRPTLGELYRSGYSPAVLRQAHGSWFEFVQAEGHLTAEEARVLGAARHWFRELETTVLEKSFKMVLLEALIELGGLRAGAELGVLAARSHQILVRSSELLRDIRDVKELPEPTRPDAEVWLSYWRKNPVKAWTGTRAEPKRWFAVEGDRFLSRIPAPEDLGETLVEMTREIVDYRLAQYRRRFETGAQGDAFACKVISNGRDPILMLPPREARPDLPRDDTDVRLPSGAWWRFRFVKIACNVAHPVGSARNELPDLLRGWFGPSAGKPGTAFRVRYFRTPDGWSVEPLGQVIELPPRGRVVAFPTLRAAAGHAGAAVAAPVENEEVVLPVRARREGLIAVRATGDSMNGGKDPIRDGDWLVFHYARGAGLGAVEGRVVLVQVQDGTGDGAYQVKRVVREAGKWRLNSDNPDAPSFEASPRTVPIALLVERISPDDLGPDVGEHVANGKVGEAFGVGDVPRSGRVDGHLFILVEWPGVLVASDRVRWSEVERRPGETAFVLARAEPQGAWRYCGVGRWIEDQAVWAIPYVDHRTWKALGAGRDASRRLTDDQLEAAKVAAVAIVERVGAGGWVAGVGKRCRVLGLSAQGGIRIDGGEGAFRERTVTLTDIGWALVAKRHHAEQSAAAGQGGALDEALVNQLRYLEGTPKGSTRWIDSGWALLLVSQLD